MTTGSILVIGLSIASTLAAGLASDLAGLRRAVKTRATWAALAGNLVVVPLFAGLVMPQVAPGPAVTGLLLVAAAPGGGIGPLLALLGRGDASLASALFLVLSLAGTVAALALTLVLDTPVTGVLRAAVLVAVTALAPLAVGIATGRAAPRIAQAVLPWASRLGALLLVSTVVWFTIEQGRDLSANVIAAAALLAAASIFAGWLAARATSRAVAVTIVEISLVRNVALTLVVVTGLGASAAAIMSVLTYALVMLVSGSVIALLAR